MNNIKKLFTFLLLLVVFASCEDQLSTQPYDLIDADAAFTSVADLNAGALGAYGAISGQNIFEINALVSDNLKRASTNTGQGMQLFNHNIIAGDGTIGGAWSNAYTVIDRLNRVLTAAEGIEGKTAEEKALKNRIKGEMLAIRAYEHFDLYRNFADYKTPDNDGLVVPYMTKSVISSPARATKSEFFALLNKDLDDAEAILSGYAYPAELSNTRMNKVALQGLRARVALYTKDWQSAIDNASGVINAVGLTSLADFPNLWDDSIEGEVIFKLKRLSSSDGTIDIFERATNSDIYFYASDELTGLYDAANDIRYATYFNDDGSGDVQVSKYNKRAGLKNVVDIKLMRVSEMYLIRAEAYAQPGAQQDLAAAAADINTLRTARYTTPAVANFGTSAAALDAIRLETRLELPYEGFHFYNLKRAGLPVTRIPADVDASTASSGLEANSKLFVFPIPQFELFANENMTPNPSN